jgi:hypothetical protein
MHLSINQPTQKQPGQTEEINMNFVPNPKAPKEQRKANFYFLFKFSPFFPHFFFHIPPPPMFLFFP